MSNCTGNCDQGRECNCCGSCHPTGMPIVIGAAVGYGIFIGVVLAFIFNKIWEMV